MASEVFSAKRYSAEVNVLAFDADPTGVEDCTEAFTKAVAECKTRDYATLYVPAGKYRFASTTAVTGWPTPPPAAPPQCAWQMIDVTGLCIRGDGALRSASQEGHFTGTTLVFDIPPAGTPTPVVRVGLLLWKCTGIRFENITFQGAPPYNPPTDPTPPRDERAIGVRIESLNGEVGSTGIQFQNCSFMWCHVGVQTGESNNNSELAFYDCAFSLCTIGYQSLHDQALVQKFIGCIAGGNGEISDDKFIMDVMFDLEAGGNITVVGFVGLNMRKFVVTGTGGANIGWNNFYNVRLEEQDPFSTANRTRIYEALDSTSSAGGQRSAFHGLVIVSAEETTATGHSRFYLYHGHEVYAWNLGRSAYHNISTSADPLVRFPGGEVATRGGIFRCYGSNVPFDARLDRDDVPALAKYSFQDCQEVVGSEIVLYPDLYHPPIYGPNYLMTVESHCCVVGDMNGVNVAGTGTAQNMSPTEDYRAGVIRCEATAGASAFALASAVNAMRFTGGSWRCQISARFTEGTSASWAVRLGFGDNAGGEPANGLYFLYDGVIGFWQVVRRVASSTVAVTTTVVANTAWRTFEIAVDEAGNSTFYIDGAEVHTSTSPTADMGLLPLQVHKISGTQGLVRAEIDYFRYQFIPATRGQFYPE